jgi:hypothetical protein
MPLYLRYSHQRNENEKFFSNNAYLLLSVKLDLKMWNKSFLTLILSSALHDGQINAYVSR